MRKIWIFVKREYKAAVRTKGFIIGLIIAPVFMGGSLIAFAIMKDRVDTTDKTIALLDRSGVLTEAVVEAAEYRNENEIFDKEKGNKIKPAYFFESIPSEKEPEKLQDQRLALSDRVRSGEFHAFLEIGPDIVHPGENPDDSGIKYFAKNAAMDDVRGWVVWPINNALRKLRLADSGIAEEDVKDLFVWINVEGLGLVSMDDTGDIQDAKRANEIEAILVPIIMMMLMFLMVMMSVPGMLQSVMEEKTQRIAEVLLGSVSPFQFMMGKVIGGIAVSITSASVYLIGGAWLVHHLGYQDFVPFHVIPWFVTYMLLAITMFGAMSAALGSTCSEAKDAQSLSFPVMLPIIFPMFIYFPIVREPMGQFATICSLIPPFTPMLMLIRQATPGGVPAWQPIVGLIGVLIFTVLFVWTGGRIFRVAILMQGTPPNFSKIFKWALKG